MPTLKSVFLHFSFAKIKREITTVHKSETKKTDTGSASGRVESRSTKYSNNSSHPRFHFHPSTHYISFTIVCGLKLQGQQQSMLTHWRVPLTLPPWGDSRLKHAKRFEPRVVKEQRSRPAAASAHTLRKYIISECLHTKLTYQYSQLQGKHMDRLHSIIYLSLLY